MGGGGEGTGSQSGVLTSSLVTTWGRVRSAGFQAAPQTFRTRNSGGEAAVCIPTSPPGDSQQNQRCLRPGFKPQPCHLPVCDLRASYFISLGLSFLICTMGVVVRIRAPGAVYVTHARVSDVHSPASPHIYIYIRIYITYIYITYIYMYIYNIHIYNIHIYNFCQSGTHMQKVCIVFFQSNDFKFK